MKTFLFAENLAANFWTIPMVFVHGQACMHGKAILNRFAYHFFMQYSICTTMNNKQDNGEKKKHIKENQIHTSFK